MPKRCHTVTQLHGDRNNRKKSGSLAKHCHPFTHNFGHKDTLPNKATLPTRCHTVTQSRDVSNSELSVALYVVLQNHVTLSHNFMKTGTFEKKLEQPCQTLSHCHTQFGPQGALPNEVTLPKRCHTVTQSRDYSPPLGLSL